MKQAILVGVLASALVSCGKDSLAAFDTQTYDGRVYLTASDAVLSTCGTVNVGNLANVALVPTDATPNRERYIDPYHLSTKSNGYVKTALSSDEYVLLGASKTLTNALLKRPGTYVYVSVLGRRYNWTMTFECTATGKKSTFTQSGTFKHESRVTAVVFNIQAGADGSLSVTQAESPDALSPQEKQLP